MSSYVPLRVHSEYSLLSGLSQTKHILSRLEEIEVEACALTDAGTVSGAVDFNKRVAGGFKPILGCDLFISPLEASIKEPSNLNVSNQTVLAKNLSGWKGLLSMVSASNRSENFCNKPRLGSEQFLENVSPFKGSLVSFSGPIGSVLGNMLLENPDWKTDAIQEAEKMENAFGKGNFYIAIQLIDALNNSQTREVAEKLREVAKITGIPCIGVPNSYYCKREDADDQRVLLCTALRKSIGQVQRELKQGNASEVKSFFESDSYHLPTYEEMSEVHTPEELDNTLEISSMCSNYDILGPPSPPEFSCPEGMSPDELLRLLCRDGWREKMSHVGRTNDNFPEYGKRVDKEISIFTEAGLSSYFLIVQDILRYAKSRNYLIGPGRGSAAGCMVSYLIGITQIDPVPYNLIFERFYNAGRNAKGRVSMPDIDIDVPKHSRADIIQYIQGKYGTDNVAQIVTFQTLKGRAALKRVMAARGNISFAEQNAITSHILDEAKIADELQDMRDELGTASVITWALENKAEKLKDWCELDEEGNLQGKLSKIFEQAVRLEGTKIIQSKHAAGVVISPLPIYDVCPMVIDREGKGLLAGFEGPSCEDVGLLKLDILGIKMLDKVMDVSNILKV
jgi:DNA polymerase-3 subunit alpha